MHVETDADVATEFAGIVGDAQLLTGERIGPDYHHDEALVGAPVAPRYVARPQSAEQVTALRGDGAALLVTTTDAVTKDELVSGEQTAVILHGADYTDNAETRVACGVIGGV